MILNADFNSSLPSSEDLPKDLTHRRLHSLLSSLWTAPLRAAAPTDSGAVTHLSVQLGLFFQLSAYTQFKGTPGYGGFVSSAGEALPERTTCFRQGPLIWILDLCAP